MGSEYLLLARHTRWQVRLSSILFCVLPVGLHSLQINASGLPPGRAQDPQGMETSAHPRADLPTDHPPNSRQRLVELAREGRWAEVATLGQARLNLHDSIGAIKALRAAERLGMGTFDLRLALGGAYFNLNQFFLFQQQMEKAIRTNPALPEPYYALGRYYEAVRKDVAGALTYFEKASTLNPGDARTWAHRGYCLEMLTRNQEARRAYETAIALNKDEKLSLPYEGLARLSLQTEPERALSFAKKAAELEPDSDASHFLLARVYQRLGRLPDAIAELELTIRLDPTNLPPRLVLSQIYNKAGQKEAAKEEMRMIGEIRQTYGVR
jgi:tetratricopeptide (TPR) repeat protein